MRAFRFWFPPIFWMALIFFLSSRPSLKVSEQGILNFIFFKTLHVVEYAMLYFLNYRAVKNSFIQKRRFWFGAAFILTMLYAISDEIHQLFVPTREGKVRDVIIDAIGAVSIWYLIAKWLPKAPTKLRSWGKNWEII